MQGAIAEGWGEGAGLAASMDGSFHTYPHPSLRATCIRVIHDAHPSGGIAVQIGNPADLSPTGRRETLI